VDASCRNEKGISRLNRETRQARLNPGIGQRLSKNFRSNVRLQSQAEFGARAGSDCIPHFRFTYSSRRSFMLAGIFVIRVNLHRKLIPREDELYKQGNARTSL
jgi:hypothetical protein